MFQGFITCAFLIFNFFLRNLTILGFNHLVTLTSWQVRIVTYSGQIESISLSNH